MNYRGYSLCYEDGRHVARPLDGDNLAIISRDLRRLTKAVCEFWIALSCIDRIRAGETDLIPVSRCVRDWIIEPTEVVDLDSAYMRGAC